MSTSTKPQVFHPWSRRRITECERREFRRFNTERRLRDLMEENGITPQVFLEFMIKEAHRAKLNRWAHLIEDGTLCRSPCDGGEHADGTRAAMVEH